MSSVSGRAVTFGDGAGEYDTVVWATGFTQDDPWVDIPGVHDVRGRLRQSRGVAPFPGVYTLGRSWQHTRGSALLGWVGDDAAYLAGHIIRMPP